MPETKEKGRVLVVIQIILMAAILIFSFRDKSDFAFENIGSYIGFGIVIIGSLFALISFINFGQIMTPNPVPLQNYKLRTSGMYKYIRHPVYSTLLFALLGLVIYSQSISGLIFWAAAVVFIIYKIGFEESSLIIKFKEYKGYQRRTKKLIPLIY